MHYRLLVLALAVFLLTSVGAARADDPDPDAPGGFYVGVGGVYAFENFDFAFDDSAGVELRLGWRWNRWIATELRYEWLEGFDSTGPIRGYNVPPLNPTLGDVELDTHQVMVNAKLYPIEGPIQPYAIVGLGAFIVNTELRAAQFDKPFRIDAGFAARLGAGVEVPLSPHWAVAFEGAYLLGTGRVEREPYGTLGLNVLYRF